MSRIFASLSFNMALSRDLGLGFVQSEVICGFGLGFRDADSDIIYHFVEEMFLKEV